MTFHVRLVSLPHRTNDLVEALTADVGVSNLVVLPGAARDQAATRFSSTWRPGPRTWCSGGCRPSRTIAAALSTSTTIPAAADIALSLAYSSWGEARGSALQLLLNVTVLIAMGVLVLRAQRIIWSARERA